MKQKIETLLPRARARCGGKTESNKSSNSPDHREGVGTRETKQLHKLLEEHGARGKALAALLAALNATVGRYDPKTKTLWQEPDHRVRASAAVDILCFTDGKPIERREQVNISLNGSQQAQEKLLSSPALREAIRKKIEEADAVSCFAEEKHSKMGVENPGVA
jgi:hypothetical protein